MEAVDAGALEFRDEHGAIRTLSALRWGNACEKTFQYIPFGCEVHAERRFGDLALPNNISVGWWFDTPRYAPFFRAELLALEAVVARRAC